MIRRKRVEEASISEESWLMAEANWSTSAMPVLESWGSAAAFCALATSAESWATGLDIRSLTSQLAAKPAMRVSSTVKNSSCCTRWAKAKRAEEGTMPTRHQCSS